jgi:hypothetical protein
MMWMNRVEILNCTMHCAGNLLKVTLQNMVLPSVTSVRSRGGEFEHQTGHHAICIVLMALISR